MQARFVVIDVETTGFSRNDRIVEVAAVSIDPQSWRVTDEFDTLVNPQRDVGPVGVHGISASMVETAPTFGEIAAALARRLHRATLIAHNLPFDARMLGIEFARLGAAFDAGSGFCTYRATRYRLPLACEKFGVRLADQHRALSDARATAALASNVFEESRGRLHPAIVGHIELAPNPRTHRRDGPSVPRSELARVVSHAFYPHSDEAVLAYLAALDWALDDYRIDPGEWRALDETAEDLGVSVDARENAHRAYLTSIIAAAQRDGVTTAAEAEIIERVARVLDVADVSLPAVSSLPPACRLQPGLRVCFTGQMRIDGARVGRRALEEFTANVGMQPVASVTKSGCDLLVAGDPSSNSGKARLARKYRIPVVGAAEYLAEIEVSPAALDGA